MACNSMAIPSSPATTAQKDVFKEHDGLFRSNSVKDFCNRATMQRSYSDNHLCYSINRVRAASTQPKLKSSRSVGIFPFQIASSIIPTSLRSFLFDPETSKDMSIAKDGIEISSDKGGNIGDNSDEGSANDELGEVKRANWVERIYEIGIHQRNRQHKEDIYGKESSDANKNGESNCEGGCTVDYNSEEEGGETKYDRETFSRFLAPVAWSDIKLFSKLAFLCNMAYVIPEIKAMDLRRNHGLRFVTSSLEKKAEAAAMKEKLDQDSTHIPAAASVVAKSNPRNTEEPEQKHPIRSSVAYGIAASAASYVQSHARGLLSHGAQPQQEGECTDSSSTGNQPVKDRDRPVEDGERSQRVYKKSEVAAHVAASTMTAVVAAGEKEKQEAARDLQSLHLAPCEWFVCDDIRTHTRCFVIQGSDSLASWQANLLFEPAKFEGTDVLVHRGIYEAAKGIYDQFMPEIMEHLNKYGKRAKLQFTGHSLGGSLSLLIHLMLITRKFVKPSTLRPVVTFGSPFVFCGGQKILNHLGLDDNHVHCVVMHRDIVPRAFSCNYPNHVALVLMRLSGSFQSHPCLIKNKFLYSPLGKLFILQPDEKSSPPHPLLPPGSALYAFNKTQYRFSASAIKAFLNCPHPLETLSDPKAYGSEGTILRDHDSSNYLNAVNKVIRQNLKMVRKVQEQRNQLWPLLASPSPHSWNHENTMEKSVLGTKKVMTSA
ncbi:phospholipase A1 PLIP1, chloroplastic-like [Populus nigra]|uniref:phospholipase A1 PLIP1, chloroplastic-like n=1 Tax=Populus nigra TaxID=3691 RepID=UPI002B265B3A|nr:phospholipase A1 PLIP1, chloroplastic-like [Populus nigra]